MTRLLMKTSQRFSQAAQHLRMAEDELGDTAEDAERLGFDVQEELVGVAGLRARVGEMEDYARKRGNPSVIRGEWWIDNTGYVGFADGDVGDENHELVAFVSALQLQDWRPGDPEINAGEPLTNEAIDWLRERNVPDAVIRFFLNGADAREYQIRMNGWIRVKNDTFEMWVFDDEALKRIQRFDGWDEGAENSEEPVNIYEGSTRKLLSAPVKVLLAAQTADAVRHFADPVNPRHWHREKENNPLHEHRAHLQRPRGVEFVTYRRKNFAYSDGVDRPIDVTFGIRSTRGPRGGWTVPVTLHFRANVWTVGEARAWLKRMNLKVKKFEESVRDNPTELSRGIEEEFEHVSDFPHPGLTDRQLATRIARRHLEEDPAYYTKLKRHFR